MSKTYALKLKRLVRKAGALHRHFSFRLSGSYKNQEEAKAEISE